MRKRNEKNERIKRAYLAYLREAKGHDEASLDKVAAALLDFEEAIGFRSFKAFHREWGERYKKHLAARKHPRTGRPLGLATRDATLRLVKCFLHWLASQPGYKSRISYADVEYFNNNRKDAAAAHATRPVAHPSLDQCAHAFRHMPENTEVERRDKAVFAALMLTGARDGALASLRLGHVDLVEGKIIQDGREVRTKFAKTFETWFFPVDPMYRECFEAWVRHLRETRFYGPADALFPRQEVGTVGQRFVATGLSREPYANAEAIRAAVKAAFTCVNLPPYTPHSFRKTIVQLANLRCKSLEDHKAWSQNLGHEHLATTVSAYMPVGRERQATLIRGLAN